jgi:hypothetical protein
LYFDLDGRSDRSRLYDPRKCFFNGVIDAQSSKCDAARLTIVE